MDDGDDERRFARWQEKWLLGADKRRSVLLGGRNCVEVISRVSLTLCARENDDHDLQAGSS